MSAVRAGGGREDRLRRAGKKHAKRRMRRRHSISLKGEDKERRETL